MKDDGDPKRKADASGCRTEAAPELWAPNLGGTKGLDFPARERSTPDPTRRASPYRLGEIPCPGPSPEWEGWHPLFEESFDALERDAFGALSRFGVIAEGELIPWRGYREAWLSEIGKRSPKVESSRSDLALLAAFSMLGAIESAMQRDGASAFGSLAALASEAALPDALRVYEATTKDRQGRPAQLDAARLEALRKEAREIAGANPNLKPVAVAMRLIAKHELDLTPDWLQRKLGKLTAPKPRHRKL